MIFSSLEMLNKYIQFATTTFIGWSFYWYMQLVWKELSKKGKCPTTNKRNLPGEWKIPTTLLAVSYKEHTLTLYFDRNVSF